MTAYDDTVHGEVPAPQKVWDSLVNIPQQELKVKRLRPDAVIPTYATDGSGAFDLYAIGLPDTGVTIDRGMHGPVVIDTGLAFEVPPGHGMFILSRSGMGFKHDIRLANCVGLVDSDYRSGVKVKLTSDSEIEYCVHNGDRIAQAVILPIPRIKFVEVDELSDTERGTGGFGSTGK